MDFLEQCEELEKNRESLKKDGKLIDFPSQRRCSVSLERRRKNLKLHDMVFPRYIKLRGCSITESEEVAHVSFHSDDSGRNIMEAMIDIKELKHLMMLLEGRKNGRMD